MSRFIPRGTGGIVGGRTVIGMEDAAGEDRAVDGVLETTLGPVGDEGGLGGWLGGVGGGREGNVHWSVVGCCCCITIGGSSGSSCSRRSTIILTSHPHNRRNHPPFPTLDMKRQYLHPHSTFDMGSMKVEGTCRSMPGCRGER